MKTMIKRKFDEEPCHPVAHHPDIPPGSLVDWHSCQLVLEAIFNASLHHRLLGIDRLSVGRNI